MARININTANGLTVVTSGTGFCPTSGGTILTDGVIAGGNLSSRTINTDLTSSRGGQRSTTVHGETTGCEGKGTKTTHGLFLNHDLTALCIVEGTGNRVTYSERHINIITPRSRISI